MKLSLLLSHVGLAAAALRGNRSLTMFDPSFSGMDVASPFEPLDCNEHFSPCVTYSSIFGSTKSTFLRRMIVPCGSCIVMDFEGPVLNLQDGLDVRGKLIFPDNYELIIRTPMVVVQGELEIASTQPVNGVPPIQFKLERNGLHQVFDPVHNNRNICPVACAAGSNSFTVAGGKVTINGLPPNTPTWLKLYDVEGPSTVVVNGAVDNKWAPGAAIVITSNDQRYFGEQVRTIVGVSRKRGGRTRLELNETIVRPNTLKDDVGYAVEVALLSRNILIEGHPNGHFWILYTPHIVQTVEGVEFKKLGQTAQLGRYPIHLHMCGDMSGSRIAKNSIHDSFQRAVVLHGTDNVRVEENVAYNVKGHGFILEDGIETGNIFYKNIGIKTLNAHELDLIHRPDNDGVETDDDAATFWITNANNTWIGNVVAGSESNGFWFELLVRGILAEEFAYLDPLTIPIVEFRDNEVHSVFNFGIRYYLNGFLPSVDQIFDRTKFCRNRHVALQLHRTRNIHITNSYFADNSVGIVVDRSEGIHLENVTFVGYSQAYKDVVDHPSPYALEPCGSRRNRMDGLTFQPTNPWANDRKQPSMDGLTMKNVHFQGYANGPCAENTAVRLTPDRYTFSTFEMFAQLDGVTVEPDTVDFCDGIAIDAYDAYISDVSSSLFGGSSRDPATLLANTPEVTHFTKPSLCTTNPSMCTVYCKETCFRTVHYYIPQRGSENYRLKICDQLDLSNCINLKGYTHLDYWPRRFTAHVPTGRRYDLVFTDKGKEVYPPNVDIVFERKLCPWAPDENDIVLRYLPVGETFSPTEAPTTFHGFCSSIIQNGNMELGYEGYWKAYDDVTLYTTEGFDSEYALGVTGRTRAWQGASYATELINLNCLEPGSMWRVVARLKLIDSATHEAASCDPTSRQLGKTCPLLELLFRMDSWDNVVQNDVRGFRTTSWNSDDFNFFEGFFVVPESGGLQHFAMQFSDYAVGLDLIVDDFEIVRHEMPTLPPTIEVTSRPSPSPTAFSSSSECEFLTEDIDMEQEVAKYWYVHGAGEVYQTDALFGAGVGYYGRDRVWNGLGFRLNTYGDKRCMTQGSGWQITAWIKLTSSVTGEGFSCDFRTRIAGLACPRVEIAVRDKYWDRTFSIVTGFNSWDPNNFNEFRGFFWFPTESDEWIGNVRDIVFLVTDYPLETELVVDNLSIRRL